MSQWQRKSELVVEKRQMQVFPVTGFYAVLLRKDRLFYIPYFENGIYCMDIVMILQYKQHTIDTVFHSGYPEWQGRGTGEMKKLYASAPRVKVNKRSFANDRLLFIESDLRADNEDDKAFKQHPVIDYLQSWGRQLRRQFTFRWISKRYCPIMSMGKNCMYYWRTRWYYMPLAFVKIIALQKNAHSFTLWAWYFFTEILKRYFNILLNPTDR